MMNYLFAVLMLMGVVTGPVEQVLPARHLIEVRSVKQGPELFNGCEATSLAMLLAHLGEPQDKLQVAAQMPRDLTPQQVDANGRVRTWGNPNVGFVGDVTGVQPGYGIYHGPLLRLANKLSRRMFVDLTGTSFTTLQHAITENRPVVVWVTSPFQLTNEWVTWQTPDGQTIRATYREHAVLLVGYDPHYVYVNNPLTGEQAQRVERAAFLTSWEQLGKQAVTVAKF